MTSVDDSDCIVEVDETGSAELENSKLFEFYIQSTEVFVLVYSVVSRVSFERVQTLMADIQAVKFKLRKSPGGSTESVPVVLVGNKIDSAVLREVSAEEGHALAKATEASLVEVSAKEATNVDEAFHRAVRLIRKQEGPKEAERRSPAAVSGKPGSLGHKHRRCQIL
ncbi:Ras GTPase ras2 [Xylographa bjoerkii]|nr:Ras GTPase ras2 [Xylographa bjoerkii]